MRQARRRELYTVAGLPDTMDGRFHAVALHAAMIFPRLETAGPKGRRVSNKLNEIIFDSFDAALRETGVGDASIARKVRGMGEEFFGIGMAVSRALAAEDPRRKLEAALVRNAIVAEDKAPRLAEHLIAADGETDRLCAEELIAGQTGWRFERKAQ